MIWHIFKKDWKLLWPLVLAIVFAHATTTALYWLGDRDQLPDYLANFVKLFPMIAMLGSAILAISIFQSDPIPGDRQDWLARPIRRLDLLSEKILFVLLTIIAPAFLISAGGALSDGFSLAASMTVALGHVISLFVVICLPAMILGAITGNAMEAIAGIAAIVMLVVLELAATSILGLHPTLIGYGQSTSSGVDWMEGVASSGVIVVAALIILPLQYFKRVTPIARLMIVPLVLLALLLQDMLPWNLVFAVEQQMASNGASGDGVAISYDPALKRSLRTAMDAGAGESASVINLPIRVAGVPAGDVLLADRAEIRFIADGKILYHQSRAAGDYTTPGFANASAETQLRQTGAGGQVLHGYQAILLPSRILDKMRTRDLGIEIDYSLSIFHKAATADFTALNDNKRVAGIGWCRTKSDDDGDEIAIQCVRSGPAPACGSAVLENPATHQRNPETFICAPDYSPFSFQLYPDALTRFWLPMKFKDVENGKKYPVDVSQLGSARVNLATYQATGHFTRHVVIHNIRLGDWEAKPR